jgi:hypothetical protein
MNKMKTQMMKWSFLIMVTCLWCRAAVTWENKELQVTAVPGQERIDFTFPFKNEGSAPVQLSAPTASCDCTLATLEKTTYAAGEAGVIKGSYDLAGRSGVNGVTITVRGSELSGENRRSFVGTLKLHVTIPQSVKITPSITLWRKDAKAEPKSIRFEVDKSYPLELKFVKISNGSFKSDWRVVQPGQLYELVVTPTVPLEAGSAMITVDASVPGDKRIEFHAHLLVR